MVVDFECVSSCYHKYLYSVKTINEALTEEGRLYYSEYISNAQGAEQKDRFKDHVFPLGGHPATQGGPPLRRKFFESYHYSDPLKVGR